MAKSNSTRLTDKFIRALKPPASGYRIYTDSEVPGLGVRITHTGVLSFTLDYWLDNKTHRRTLAPCSLWSATAARKKALECRRQLSEGTDPFAVPHKQTMADLAADYMQLHALPHKRTRPARQDQQILDRNILPALGATTLAAKVTAHDIQTLHASLKSTPYQANRMLALLSKMFNLAVTWDYCESNPCKGVKRFTESPRERYLAADELKRLVAALDAYPDRNTASAVALIMLTGSRKTEVLAAEWSMFDLDAGIWSKPSHHTKQKRSHRVPLSPAAVTLLRSLPHTDPVYVFPGRFPGQPLIDIHKAWEKLLAAAGIADLRVHDLRHSYASMLVNKNLSLPIIGRLLGHTKTTTTERYAHLQDAALQEATDLVGELVEGTRK